MDEIFEEKFLPGAGARYGGTVRGKLVRAVCAVTSLSHLRRRRK